MMYEFILLDGTKLIAMLGSFYLKENTDGKVTVFLGTDAYQIKESLNDFKYNISKLAAPVPNLR